MRRFLLDTNIIVRWLYEPDSIPANLLEPLSRGVVPPIISAITPYELALKSNVGKLGIDVGDLLDRVIGYGVVELPVRASHAMEAGRLPLFNRDPFDRLLVAQARLENCILVTTDVELSRFEVEVQHVPR